MDSNNVKGTCSVMDQSKFPVTGDQTSKKAEAVLIAEGIKIISYHGHKRGA